jgi:predicted nuclease with TOPRIM domain
MNLYEIKESYLHLLQKIESGEVPEDCITDTLESIESDFEEKADNIASYIKSLLSDAVALKSEADKLSERKKQKEDKADKLIKYLEKSMKECNISKIETTRNVIHIKLCPASVKLNEDIFIEWAKNCNKWDLFNKPSPSKKAIKEAIENGEKIPYCTLEKSEKLHLK